MKIPGAWGTSSNLGHDVFVSYSAKDQALAEILEAHIRQAGLTVFLAPKSLSPGEVWAERIRSELRNCRCVVVLLSPQSIGSEWVITEWGAAWALDKLIIPVLHRCEPEQIPRRLADLQACDFYQFENTIHQIAVALPPAIDFDPFGGATQQPVILSATAIQPAFQAICGEAEERLRLFLHVLGPPKITDALASIIAKRVAERKNRSKPLRFSPVLALDFDHLPPWFWQMFDARNEIYGAHDILELTAGRFFHIAHPTGIDVVVIDRLHVMLMVTTVEGSSGTQTGLVLRNNPLLAAEYIDWFDNMIWANAKTRGEVS